MFFRVLTYVWKRKLEIARLDREVKLTQLAHEQAHSFALTSTDSIRIASGNCPEYKEKYLFEFTNALNRLGIKPNGVEP